MKKLLYFLFAISFSAVAQDVRTQATRIADALALLSARDATTAARAYSDFIALDDEGLSKIMDGIRPSGEANGVPYRYAVALLSSHVSPADRSRIENAFLAALGRQTNTEVKQYFIQHLSLVGTDQSVQALSGLLSHEQLADPAIGALEAIGSDAAMSALIAALNGKPNASMQIRIMQALGNGRYKPSVSVLKSFATSPDAAVRRQALWSLAQMGVEGDFLADQASAVGFKATSGGEMDALMEYAKRHYAQVYTRVDASVDPFPPGVGEKILINTLSPDQQHYRIAVLSFPTYSVNTVLLIKELNRFDQRYRVQILNLAAKHATQESRKAWIRVYDRSTGQQQAEILAMLAGDTPDDKFIIDFVLPALDSKYPEVKKVAIQTLGATRNAKYADRMAAILINPSRTAEEIQEASIAFLQIAQPENIRKLANLLPQASPAVAINIMSVVAARRDVEAGPAIVNHASSTDPKLRAAAFAALPNVASPAILQKLFALLPKLEVKSEIESVQKALIAMASPETTPAILKESVTQKTRLLPVLPYLMDPQSLTIVKSSFEKGLGEEKELAFVAFTNWQTTDAAPELLSLLRDKNQSAYHPRSFQAYVRQINASNWPGDQKLLKLREVFPLAASTDERKALIREAGAVRTFQSFAFVASYLDDPDLGATASRAVMRLALPTADGQPGMTGQEVRKALEKVMEKLTGPDSQYDRIDVQTYLDQLPFTIGFEKLFNGKDLSGWQGLVENPIARAKMTKEELARKQAVANAKISESWSVKDGMICFTGTGDNLCTKKLYGDFEMLVDYKISKDGDSGLYLRGSPQVQIWDIARTDVGAQVGSGGLYNNTANRNPLVVADNPIGDWNTLRVTMIGERVTVYLNGILVVDNIVMENYWDRKLPIFPDGPIELQAHGTELAFRDLYVKELNRPYQLTAAEKQQGFEVLFNGSDLNGWVGNKTDYVVEDHVIAINPTGRGKGNLYTEKEYADFVYRFEFQLTPAGNNGLGIHAPLEGDAAYVGKEIQILDDGHPSYANIKPYQAHGSVYGIIAAKRGFLRPTGEWNYEEVEVRGDKIKVTLNGIVIVDGDMKKASLNGTLDKLAHPGLQRNKGHIGFLGHGSVVRFRNIRIRNLSGIK